MSGPVGNPELSSFQIPRQVPVNCKSVFFLVIIIHSARIGYTLYKNRIQRTGGENVVQNKYIAFLNETVYDSEITFLETLRVEEESYKC